MRTVQPAALLAAALVTGAPVPAQTLEKVLSRMDETAGAFRGMSARLKWVQYTKVLNDNSEENGEIWIKQSNKTGLRMRIEISKPDRKSYAFFGRKLEIYYPNMQTVQEYDLGKYGQLVDQFLLLGFGMSGQELLKSYTVKLLGSDGASGQPVARLELIPQSSQAREYLIKAELWISETSGQPVQQKFYQPGGDYRLATYVDVKMEPNLPDEAVKLKLPKGVKREFPQK